MMYVFIFHGCVTQFANSLSQTVLKSAFCTTYLSIFVTIVSVFSIHFQVNYQPNELLKKDGVSGMDAMPWCVSHATNEKKNTI